MRGETLAVKRCLLLEDGTFDLDMGLLVWMKSQYYGRKYNCVVRSMLVETESVLILIETGYGKGTGETVKEDNFKRSASLIEGLEKNGFSTNDIDIVINTHLHYDHCGWNRAFKDAQFIVQKAELEHARNPHRFQKGGYLKPLFEGMNYELVVGDHKVVPGVDVLFTPGHTPGHQSVVVSWHGKNLVFCGDTGAVAENIQKRNVIGISTDPVKCLESIDRLRSVPNAFYIYAHDNEQPGIP